MKITSAARLHELNASLELIHDRLIAVAVPPFDRHLMASARDDEPVGKIRPRQFVDGRAGSLLRRGKMDVALELRAADVQPQLPVQVVDESFENVVGNLVRPVDQRQLTVDDLDLGIVLIEMTQVGIVVPNLATRHPHVGEEGARITAVQIAHRCGELHRVSQRKPSPENQLPHLSPMVPCLARLSRGQHPVPLHRGLCRALRRRPAASATASILCGLNCA